MSSADAGAEDPNKKEKREKKEGRAFQRNAALAVLAGVLAIVGSYFGARQAGKESRATAKEQFEQQATASKEANTRRARAVARIMIADLDAAVLNLCQIGSRGTWYVTFVPLRSRVPNADRLLLAQQMSDDVDAWHDLQDADTRLVTWDAVQRGVVGAPVDPIDWGFKRIIKRIVDARKALEPTAGYDPKTQAKFRQSCGEQSDWKPPPKATCLVPSGLGPEDAARFPSCDEQRKEFYKRHPELLEGDPLP